MPEHVGQFDKLATDNVPFGAAGCALPDAASKADGSSAATANPDQSSYVQGGVLRFRSIEGLRFWMAWWVVLGHAANLSGLPRLVPSFMSPLFNASVAVNVFVIVSGFVVTHLIMSANEPYLVYIGRRAARLWPAYLLGLAVLVLFPQIYRFAYAELPWGMFLDYDRVRLAAVAPHYGTHLGLHLLLLHGAVPSEVLAYADSSILSPAWSLSLEWQFYLIAPFWVAACRRSRTWAIATSAIVIALVIAFRAQDVLHWRFPAFLPLSAHFFLLGIFSRLALDHIRLSRSALFYLGMAFAVSVLLALSCDYALNFNLARETLIWALFYIFILVENRREMRPTPAIIRHAHRLLGSNAWVGALGSASYSTYILHIPFLCLAFYSVAIFTPIDTQAKALIVAFLGAALVAPLSLLTYRLVELPCNRRARAWLTRDRRVDAVRAESKR
jgi:peptidoglycan/LPS O-acetylase OafA/YrhL